MLLFYPGNFKLPPTLPLLTGLLMFVIRLLYNFTFLVRLLYTQIQNKKVINDIEYEIVVIETLRFTK